MSFLEEMPPQTESTRGLEVALVALQIRHEMISLGRSRGRRRQQLLPQQSCLFGGGIGVGTVVQLQLNVFVEGLVPAQKGHSLEEDPTTLPRAAISVKKKYA